MRPKPLTGISFKLADRNGTYLGVLIVPEWVARQLNPPNSDRIHDYVTVRMLIREVRAFPTADDNKRAEMAGCFTIYPSMALDGAIEVSGINIGALSSQTGFAFLPGAAYLADVRLAPG